jgi:hypothetical protein
MARRNYPPIELVFQCFDYRDGELFWKNRPREHFIDDRVWKIWNTKYAGEEAGCAHFSKCGNCYRWVVGLSGKSLERSVLVWAWHHQDQGWPTLEIDHIDSSDPLDDRIENLRLATRSQQGANRAMQSNNTSGYKGVTWDYVKSRWKAHIRVKGKTINLGHFDTPEQAHEEYKKAAIKYFGEYAYLS